ncbi:MAG TPA: serine/threonine-protein kinase [Kofleriaceae bacterium]|nr:serine/threonine-protein kinase [Kofleriaceae bacterium]
MTSAGASAPRDRALGDYQLLAKLATGGMAEIFLARKGNSAERSFDEVVVVKRILPHLADDEHFVTMFRDEANLASQLVHPNVCRVHKLGQAQGVWFIVMEYLHGVALSRMLSRLSKQRHFLDVRAVAGLIEQACAGLHHAHEAKSADGLPLGVVHRDVSPPNILITTGGEVKLLDFGIAKARGASSKTRTGTVKGKNAYMSPEQILGKPLDRRSDVFALGAVMYELLAVKRLFHRESDFLTFKAITEEPLPDIRDRRPDLPPAMVAVLTRALAREPGGRFSTCAEMAEAVRQAIAPLGGAATTKELSLIISRDFADELAAKEDILNQARKTAHTNNDTEEVPTLVASSSSGQLGAAPTQVAASPFGAAAEELEPIDGEMIIGDIGPDEVTRNQRTPASMMIGHTPATPTTGGRASRPAMPPPIPGKSQVQAAVAGTTAAPDNVSMIELADPSTDLLGDWRRRRMKRLIVLGVALAAASALFVVFGMGGKSSSAKDQGGDDVATGAAAVIDAAEEELVLPIDAALPLDASRETIIAENRYGYLTIKSAEKITVYIDGQRIVNDAFDQYPLRPGPYKVKVTGPRGKTKRFEIVIEATKTVTQNLEW